MLVIQAPSTRLAAMNRLACCAAAAMLLTFGLACSSEDSVDPQEVCNTFCTKADTCGFLVVGDVASCVAQCVSGQTSNGQTCEPSANEARACIAAYEAQSCDDLQNGVEPAACAAICPDGSDGGVTGDDAGVNSDGGGNDAMINTDGGINYGPICEQLNTCCQSLSGQEQAGCQLIADMNDENTCAGAIGGYPQCTGVDAGPPPDMGSPVDMGTPVDMGSPVDTGTPGDTGPVDQGTPGDAGVPGDTGPSGMACADLNMCCPTLMSPQLMQACTVVASMMDEGNCQMALDAFRQNGLCL